MKKLLCAIFLLLSASHGFSQLKTLPEYFNAVNKFLSDNVKDGKVDYKAISKDKKDLNTLVNFIGQKQSFETSLSEKAFYINSYNLLVIKSLIDAYPVKGPMAIPGFFDKKSFKVNGDMVTLNTIEKEILRKRFPDARLHFALVCGALSCPPLPSYAILPGKMDTQLTELTRQSIRNKNFIKGDPKNDKVSVSMIFNWYKDDFISAKGSVLNFINSYLANKLSPQTVISYYDYDWSLNGK